MNSMQQQWQSGQQGKYFGLTHSLQLKEEGNVTLADTRQALENRDREPSVKDAGGGDILQPSRLTDMGMSENIHPSL